jgi:diaminopimelate epimerase
MRIEIVRACGNTSRAAARVLRKEGAARRAGMTIAVSCHRGDRASIMSTNNPEKLPLEEPLAGLERQLIIEYLKAAGCDYHGLVLRNDDEARRFW